MSYPGSNEVHGVSMIEASLCGTDTDVAAPHLAVELLACLAERNVPRYAAFKSQIGRVADICGTSPDDLTIDQLYEVKPKLRKELSGRRYEKNSISAYVNDVTTLLRYAQEMGWSPWANTPKPWLPIVEAALAQRCENVCRYAVRLGKEPEELTQDDVDQWVLERFQFRGWSVTQMEANRFVKVLVKAGVWLKLSPKLKDDYGIALENMPSQIRTEIKSLLAWKTGIMAPGRLRKQKIRPVSAANVQETFSILYGWAVNIHGVVPTTVRELVSKELMYTFIVWYLSERGAAGKTAQTRLVCVLALFNQHPDYQNDNMKWFKLLIDNIPVESETDAQERRAAKQVPLDLVRSIPDRVRQTRTEAARRSSLTLAWVVQLELLLLWLVVLPWRQRNLRECRIGGKCPNLFKASLRNTPNVSKRKWVTEILAVDPDAEFWQVRFAAQGDTKPGETKNGRGIHIVLPRPLIPLLEEFLCFHRHHLLGSKKTEELFLNTRGKALSESRMCAIIGEQTLRSIGKRVTPHTYRHIVAYAFLEQFPDQFLTLSKILWHKNVMVTINTYGGTYNESNGACAMERWIEDEEGS